MKKRTKKKKKRTFCVVEHQLRLRLLKQPHCRRWVRVGLKDKVRVRVRMEVRVGVGVRVRVRVNSGVSVTSRV